MLVFPYCCNKTYLFGAYWNHLIETIPMSTNKICFGAKMMKIILNYNFIYQHFQSCHFGNKHWFVFVSIFTVTCQESLTLA